MKKKTIANLIMVAIIVAIALMGVLYVGGIKGWFDKKDENSVILTESHGIISLEREGVAYTVSEDTVLRDNDKIICEPGATADIIIGDSYITLGQGANVVVLNSHIEGFSLRVDTGEVFINAESEMIFSFFEREIKVDDAVANLSVRSGAQSISVYYGKVENAESGQILEWLGDDISIRTCFIDSLNAFNISQIRKANETKNLCFSNADLEELEAKRQEQVLVSDDGVDGITTETISDDTVAEEFEEINTEPTEAYEASTTETIIQATIEATAEETTEVVAGATTATTTETTTEATTEAATEATTEETTLSCTISITCSTILNNWDSLDPAKAPYVPSDGCILSTVTVEFTEGETVFDVLNRVCSTYGIQLEYSWTPMYNSYYIEGINNLYEFDCGSESGWMYKVDGWFPNYGCSSYTLTGGENIVWCYTCVGLGADVGSSGW